MIDIRQLRDLVVRPVLEHLGLHSTAAEQLVLGTAAQESRLRWLHQVGGGPARGLWQMEPATHNDLRTNFLPYQPELQAKVEGLLAPWPSRTEQLATNLAYGAAMCRVHYRRIKAPMPPAGDVPALAAYWKRYYNTVKGKGRPEEFERNWRELVAPAELWRR